MISVVKAVRDAFKAERARQQSLHDDRQEKLAQYSADQLVALRNMKVYKFYPNHPTVRLSCCSPLFAHVCVVCVRVDRCDALCGHTRQHLHWRRRLDCRAQIRTITTLVLHMSYSSNLSSLTALLVLSLSLIHTQGYRIDPKTPQLSGRGRSKFATPRATPRGRSPTVARTPSASTASSTKVY